MTYELLTPNYPYRLFADGRSVGPILRSVEEGRRWVSKNLKPTCATPTRVVIKHADGRVFAEAEVCCETRRTEWIEKIQEKGPKPAMEDKKTVLDSLRVLAYEVLGTLIKHSGQHGTFKGMFTIVVAGEEKPVLVLGNAHGLPMEDGHAIAVLNPDMDLHDLLHAGTAYSGGRLKEIVAGKCDAMVDVWLDAYKPKEHGEATLNKYVNRTFVPAKFKVR